MQKNDFLSFIDSKAIREHNKSYTFTPAEQAVLISRSCKKTVEEKLAALEYIFDKYSEHELDGQLVGMTAYGGDMAFGKRLAAYISSIKASLELTKTAEGYAFITAECEHGFEYGNERYYTSYQTAYAALAARHEYLSKELPECKYEFRITTIATSASSGYRHIYDNDLRLVWADPVFTDPDDFPALDISQYFVWVPLPFKKGDLLKAEHRCKNAFTDEYAVYSYPYDENDEAFTRQLRFKRQSGDISDIQITLDYFYEDERSPLGGEFCYDDFDPLELDYCGEDDTEQVNYGTKNLQPPLMTAASMICLIWWGSFHGGR